MTAMNKPKKDRISLKKASSDAKRLIKKLSKLKSFKTALTSVVILAVGVALGIAFDEFELFLGIATALGVIIIITGRNNNI